MSSGGVITVRPFDVIHQDEVIVKQRLAFRLGHTLCQRSRDVVGHNQFGCGRKRAIGTTLVDLFQQVDLANMRLSVLF